MQSINTVQIANIAGASVEEYVYVARRMNDTDISLYEVNVSCPNVKHGGVNFGTDAVVLKNVVREVKDGDRLEQGLMLLAAGDHHMRLARDTMGFYASSKTGMRVNGHMPSVEVLFESVSKVAGRRSVGIILTGMGGDGAEGLLQMRQAGAYTIGQDQESSVVYGMPMMAFNKGAVIKQLPLGEITAHLIAQVGRM